ncbi:hypothetical protein EV175_000970 [Coemansia sp. RSA 1933]|nr:hypothetical protein EV175_000970 [Coemansia sp. RSA 1933]
MVGITRHKSHKRVRFAPGSGNGSSDTGEGVVTSYNTYTLANEYNSYEDNDGSDGLEADISSSRRRNRGINMDGYGSDASEQDEVANMSDYSDDAEDREGHEDSDMNAENKQSGQNNDEDMFADEKDNLSLTNSKDLAENKRKRYLDLDDIEGQEMSSTSRVDMAEDSNALRKERKREGKQPSYNTGSGFGDKENDDDSDGEGRTRTQIEAFNMREDLEQGQFDAHGNFVWNKKDPNDYQDGWLDGVSKKAIKQARDSKARQDQDHTVQENSILQRWDAVSNDDIIVGIINRLRSRETIFSALARIGGPKKKTKNKWSKKAKTNKDGGSNDSEDGEREMQRKKDIDELTELADQAMARGLVNIYDHTYEQFVRQMRMTDRIPDDWEPGTKLPTSAFGGMEEDVTTIGTHISSSEQTGNSIPELDADGDGGLLDDLDDLGETH